MKTLFRMIPILLLFISVNLTAETVTATCYAGGDGTEANPYQISNLAELRRLSETSADWDRHFILTADIDATDTKNWDIGDHDDDETTPNQPMGFSPIGSSDIEFAGVFNGNEHEVDNLFIARPEESNTGFIGLSYGGIVRNLSLANVNILGANATGGVCGLVMRLEISGCSVSGTVFGNNSVGGLVGNNLFESEFTDCSAKCVITGNRGVGGLIGESDSYYSSNSTYSVLTDCFSVCTVSGVSYVGGFIGDFISAEISRCYSEGKVFGMTSVGGFSGFLGGMVSICYTTGTAHGLEYVGGFSGRVRGNVNNCYSTGLAQGSESVGGFAGVLEAGLINNSYATGAVVGDKNVAGFIGYNCTPADPGKLNSCFWDADTTGQDKLCGDPWWDERNIFVNCGGLTSSEFIAHDFSSDAWKFGSDDNSPWKDGGSNGRPYLYWQDVIVSNGLVEIDANQTQAVLKSGYVYNNSDASVVECGFIWSDKTGLNITTGEKVGNHTTFIKKHGSKTFTTAVHVVKGKEYFVRAYAIDEKGHVFYGDLCRFKVSYSGGIGAGKLPYLLKTAEDLKILSESPEDWGASFKLGSDIDLSDSVNWNVGDHDDDVTTPDEPMGFSPIGDAPAVWYYDEANRQRVWFTGYLDGNGYVIKGLAINRPKERYVGLFGFSYYSNITNVSLKDTFVKGGEYTGGLIGYSEGGKFTGCSVVGSVSGGRAVGGMVGLIRDDGGDFEISGCHTNCSVNGEHTVGGVVGYASSGTPADPGWAVITNSHAAGEVTGTNLIGGFAGCVESTVVSGCYSSGYVFGVRDVGGFAGELVCDIKACYSSSTVTGTTTVGGFAGVLSRDVNNCYSTGLAQGDSCIGGFAGITSGRINNCYTSGAVVGENSEGGFSGMHETPSRPGIINNCFWDVETTGQSQFCGENWWTGRDDVFINCGGLSSSEFIQYDFSSSGWNFGNDIGSPWKDRGGNGRPYLYWQKVTVSNGSVLFNDDNTSAELRFGYIYNGSQSLIKERGFIYSTENDLSVDSSLKVGVNNTTLSPGNSSNITATIPIVEGQNYYFRVYAIDDNDNVYYGDYCRFKANYSGGFGVGNSPYLIKTAEDLKRLSETPGDWKCDFKLVADIDISDSVNWNVGDHDDDSETPDEPMGFSPIGNADVKFTGLFNGDGNVITGLTINRPNKDKIGLFGYAKEFTINNVFLASVSISGNENVGGLVGYVGDSATISGCHLTGNVYGNKNIGGLIGYIQLSYVDSVVEKCHTEVDVFGTGNSIGGLLGVCKLSYSPSESCIIRECYTTGDIQGDAYVGGVVGSCEKTRLYDCFASGTITGSDYVGGLIGENYKSDVSRCYATGTVLGCNYCGGLVGRNTYSSVRGSYATSSVTGDNSIGGLVGYNSFDSTVKNCYATGSTTGRSFVGGAVGYRYRDSLIENSYATGTVSGRENYTGAIAGVSYSNSSIKNCFWDRETTGQFFSAEIDDNHGLSTAEFIAKDFSSLWLFGYDDENPWQDRGEMNYPHLYWQKVYLISGAALSDSDNARDMLKYELNALKVDNVLDDKLAAYQKELSKAIKFTLDYPELVQLVIDAVNEGDNIAMITVSEGWNLISSPHEGWSINDSVLLKQHTEPYLFNYSNCKYRYNHKSTVLRPGVGYWIYLDGLEEGKEYPVLISGKKVDDESIHLQQDWNLVGLKAEQQVPEDGEELYPEPIMGVYGWNCVDETYSEIEDEMELGYGYWILSEQNCEF